MCELTPENRALLEKHGWTVENESPLQIGSMDGSFATGRASHYVIKALLAEELGVSIRPVGEPIRRNQRLEDDLHEKFLKAIEELRKF
jgi:hypothetical protein